MDHLLNFIDTISIFKKNSTRRPFPFSLYPMRAHACRTTRTNQRFKLLAAISDLCVGSKDLTLCFFYPALVLRTNRRRRWSSLNRKNVRRTFIFDVIRPQATFWLKTIWIFLCCDNIVRKVCLTFCMLFMAGKEYHCSKIDYFPKDEYTPDPNDSTMAIPCK